jgi:sugar phosphate isomerase/epimerase
MKPSLWTAFFYEPEPEKGPGLGPEKAIAAIKAAGFRNCEMAFEHMDMLVCNRRPEKRLEEFRRAVEPLKVSIGQLHAPITSHFISPKLPEWKRGVDLLSENEEIRRKEMKLLEDWLGYCRILDIPVLVVHPGGAKGWRNRTEYRQTCRANQQVFRRLADEAERAGISVAVENMGGGMFGSYPEDLPEMVREIDSPHLGVCLDTSHANVVGPGFDIPRFIRDCSKKLFATHISDNLGKNDDHLLPYAGRVAWQPIIKALKDIKYVGLFNLEIPGERKCPVPEILDLKARFAFDLLRVMLL